MQKTQKRHSLILILIFIAAVLIMSCTIICGAQGIAYAAGEVAEVRLEDGTLVGEYTDIASAWTAASNAGTATVKLLADQMTDEALTIVDSSDITLDLNGYMLKYNDLTARNPVFTVNGNFTLADSNASAGVKRQHNYYINTDGVWTFVDDDFEPAEGQEIKALIGGVITGGTGHHVWEGGNLFYYGGGVFIGNGATFAMQSGSICGNYARYGSGVYVDSNATFTMSGGSICGNRASEDGGVYVYGGTFTMEGGSISENSATHGGGVYVMGSTFEMSDGEISSNTSGVYFVSGEFKISGAPVIKDNCNSDGRVNNAYLEGYATIAVIGELKEGAIIGVSKTGVVAAGYNQSDDPSKYFIPDNPANNCIYVNHNYVSVGTHNWDNAPWLSDDSNHWHKCQNGCGEKQDEAAHNYNQNVAHEDYLVPGAGATCGHKATYYLSCECGVHGTDTFEHGELVDHTEVDIPAVPATCTAKGKTEGKKCTVCGEITLAQTETDMIAHTEVTDNAVPATCTQDGKTEGKHCFVCNTVTVPQTTVEATGHDYGEWTVTKEPTVNEEGEKQHVCSHDSSHIETQAIAKLPAEDKGLSAGAKAGISIGVIIFLVLVAYVVCYFVVYRGGLITGKALDVIFMPMNLVFGKKKKDEADEGDKAEEKENTAE